MLYNLYKKKWYDKLDLYINIIGFDLKIEKINKIHNSFNIYDNQNTITIDKIKNKDILNLLINLSMRRGYKKLASKVVKNAFLLLKKFFWTELFFFIRLILIKSEAVFTLQRYFLGKREKVIPRFINEKKKIKYVLRILIKHARILQKEYKYFSISLVHAILDYSKANNPLIIANRQDNELAETNKYFLFKRNKKKKKVRLFRKINHWKKLIK